MGDLINTTEGSRYVVINADQQEPEHSRFSTFEIAGFCLGSVLVLFTITLVIIRICRRKRTAVSFDDKSSAAEDCEPRKKRKSSIIPEVDDYTKLNFDDFECQVDPEQPRSKRGSDFYLPKSSNGSNVEKHKSDGGLKGKEKLRLAKEKSKEKKRKFTKKERDFNEEAVPKRGITIRRLFSGGRQSDSGQEPVAIGPQEGIRISDARISAPPTPRRTTFNRESGVHSPLSDTGEYHNTLEDLQLRRKTGSHQKDLLEKVSLSRVGTSRHTVFLDEKRQNSDAKEDEEDIYMQPAVALKDEPDNLSVVLGRSSTSSTASDPTKSPRLTKRDSEIGRIRSDETKREDSDAPIPRLSSDLPPLPQTRCSSELPLPTLPNTPTLPSPEQANAELNFFEALLDDSEPTELETSKLTKESSFPESERTYDLAEEEKDRVDG
eukprot:m.42865 g.42865  ORF g.42865 m.42865 type:complete len:435 (-) comp9924_c0_seq1:1722-3026(-)